MPGVVPNGSRYRFGPFELNTGEESLARNGIRVKLQDLPFRLLVMLLERPGEIVTREELRQHLWPENTFVECDNSLGVAIRKVRESLNDNVEAPKYVATVPRRGYRFVAPVIVHAPETKHPLEPAQEAVAVPTAAAVSDTPPNLNPAFRLRPGYLVAAGLALLLLIAGAVFRFRARPSSVSPNANVSVTPSLRVRRSVAVLGFRNLPGRREDDWLSPGFSEMLDTELGTRGVLRMVFGEDIARAK